MLTNTTVNVPAYNLCKVHLLPLLAVHLACLPAATKNCSQAFNGYRFFGGGYFSDGSADHVGPNYDSGSAADAAACATWCQEDAQCIKWIFVVGGNCYRLSSRFTGTTMDAALTSGFCYGSSSTGEDHMQHRSSLLLSMSACWSAARGHAPGSVCMIGVVQGLSLDKDLTTMHGHQGRCASRRSYCIILCVAIFHNLLCTADTSVSFACRTQICQLWRRFIHNNGQCSTLAPSPTPTHSAPLHNRACA
jgi:hypothetical protein